MLISVNNRSTVVSDSDVKLIVNAVNVLLPEFANAWQIQCPTVVFSSSSPTDWIFHMIDEDTSEPDALAYHTEEQDDVDGYILCKAVLDNEGVILYKDLKTPTIASALFHEIAEALMDPYCNTWWINDSDNKLYATEVCDPVQDSIITVQLNTGQTVGLSNFIYPAWANSQATTERFDFLKLLNKPFTLAKGGYVVVLDPTTGQTTNIFGELMPKWLVTQKQKSLRNTSRKNRCKK